jgi:type III secretion protein V
MAGQILRQPKAIAITSGMLCILGLTPGLPKIPFFVMAAATGAVAYGLTRARVMKPGEADEATKAELAAKAPEFTVTLPIVLQVGADLSPHVDLATEPGQLFYQTLTKLRTSLYYETGIVFPAIQVNGGNQFPPGSYQIWLNEVPLASGQIRLDMALVDSPAKSIAVFGLAGDETRNPSTGRPATWVRKDLRERAESIGIKVWDTHEVLLLHLGHFLRKHARDFVGIQEVQWMAARLKEYYPALVDEVVPKPISYQLLAEVLQRLADERVSIRDLKTIFGALSEVGRAINDPVELSEHVRCALKRNICYQLSEGKPTLFVYQLDPEIEELFRNSIRHRVLGPQVEMESDTIGRIVASTRSQIGDLPATAQRPVILTHSDIRRFVKNLLAHDFPELSVLSFDQLTPQIRVQPLATIALARAAELEIGR